MSEDNAWAVLPGEEIVAALERGRDEQIGRLTAAMSRNLYRPAPPMAPLCIRHGTMADLPYCEDTWSKAAVKDRGGPLGERWVRVDGERLLLAPNEWHEMNRERIRATLGRSGILVGHRADAPDVVWAWVAFEVEHVESTAGDVLLTLHWTWTRPELRGRGYAQALLVKARTLAGIAVNIRTRCSHMTPAGETLIAKVTP